MSDVFDQVAEFQRAYGQPIASTPTKLSVERECQRYNFLSEEFDEYDEALTNDDEAEVLDALADIIYVATGTMIEKVGPHLARKILDEVHRSNMSKLGEDGKPIIEGGKVRKGPNYSPPDIPAILSSEGRVTVHKRSSMGDEYWYVRLDGHSVTATYDTEEGAETFAQALREQVANGMIP